MSKIEKLKRLLDCDLCHKILASPVTVPCGNTICKSHVAELLTRRAKQKSSFICELCQDEHSVPDNGFEVNKRMKSALENELNMININVSAFNACQRTINEARQALIEIKAMSADFENFFFDHFEKLKNEVDLRRETVLAKVHEYSDNLIQTIEKSRTDCMKVSRKVNQLTEEIQNSSKELDELLKQFDTLNIDEKKFESIKSSASTLKENIYIMRVKLKESLLIDNDYELRVGDERIETQIGRIFGSLKNPQDFKKVKNFEI